jgi:phenylacetaldehyde dehydrogenase
LKKVSLELGGKSPNIIFKDAGDLESAIAGAANAIFLQPRPMLLRRLAIMVEKAIFNEVVSGVARTRRKSNSARSRSRHADGSAGLPRSNSSA